MISKVSACLCLTCDLFLITPLALLGPDDVLHKGSPAQVEVGIFHCKTCGSPHSVGREKPQSHKFGGSAYT